MTGAIPAGCSNAYSALAGVYFGEEDRESLIDLTRIAMRIGIIICAAATVLTMVLSTPLAELFVPNDAAVQELAKQMFMLTFTYLIPNVILNFILQSYRAQNRMLLVNVMSFAKTTVGSSIRENVSTYTIPPIPKRTSVSASPLKQRDRSIIITMPVSTR